MKKPWRRYPTLCVFVGSSYCFPYTDWGSYPYFFDLGPAVPEVVATKCEQWGESKDVVVPLGAYWFKWACKGSWTGKEEPGFLMWHFLNNLRL